MPTKQMFGHVKSSPTGEQMARVNFVLCIMASPTIRICLWASLGDSGFGVEFACKITFSTRQ
jgi:hypothetical protein